VFLETGVQFPFSPPWGDSTMAVQKVLNLAGEWGEIPTIPPYS